MRIGRLSFAIFTCLLFAGCSAIKTKPESPQPAQGWDQLRQDTPIHLRGELDRAATEGMDLQQASRIVYSRPKWEAQRVFEIIKSSDVGKKLWDMGLAHEWNQFRMIPLGLREFDRFGVQMLSSVAVDLKPLGVFELLNHVDSRREGGDVYINVNYGNRQAAIAFLYEYIKYATAPLKLRELLQVGGFGAAYNDLPCPRREDGSVGPGECAEAVRNFVQEWTAQVLVTQLYNELKEDGFADAFGERLLEMQNRRILGRAIARMHGLPIEYIYPLLMRTDGIEVIFK